MRGSNGQDPSKSTPGSFGAREPRGASDAAIEKQLGTAGGAVGRKRIGEVSEMLWRMLTTAIRCVGEPDRRQFFGAARPNIAHVVP